jgi:hypothetical protein
LLQDRLAREAQAHGGHARARGRSPARRAGGVDDAYLGGERSGGKAGRGSENKVPFVAAGQTTPEGQPQFVCLRQQPFTYEEVSVFAARSIAPSATVVSDGLWCFGAVQIIGAQHRRVVTGGGKASTKLPQFKAVNEPIRNFVCEAYHEESRTWICQGRNKRSLRRQRPAGRCLSCPAN